MNRRELLEAMVAGALVPLVPFAAETKIDSEPEPSYEEVIKTTETIYGRSYENQAIDCTDLTFVNCAFVNCYFFGRNSCFIHCQFRFYDLGSY